VFVAQPHLRARAVRDDVVIRNEVAAIVPREF